MPDQYRANKTKAALLNGNIINVAEINRIFNPTVVELIAQAGYSCAWIDMEHSHLDWDILSNMILAARSVDLDIFVRIPHGPYNQVIKPLELGAAGLIWPHCKNGDAARQFVTMAKFRPLGLRGMGGGRDSYYGTLAPQDYLDQANKETLLGVMIEDQEGVDQAADIAAVEGIDLLFVGPGDLAHSYGVEREGNHPIQHEKVLAAFDTVSTACQDHGKIMGTAIGPGDSMHQVFTKGTRWFNCCHELGALVNGYSQALKSTKKITHQ